LKIFERAIYLAILLCITVELGAQQVKTESGMVEGKKTKDGKVEAFLGIPYAAPPVGDLRWNEPQPVSSWLGVKKATKFGFHCMQGPIYSDMKFPDRGASEDCLTLNVWTPDASAGAKLPVMVWIYGGGFQAGSTSEPRQNGEFLARRGVVVVSMNYRLGIFGFFSHPELTKESAHRASGNYGLMDQAAALQWVKRNIAAFGGDAGNVTIFGESAGSFSVSAQMASPLAKDTIRRAIGESGAFFGGTLHTNPVSVTQEDGAKFATEVGADSLAKLRAMPAQALLDAVMKGDSSRFGPNVDGYFLPASAAEIYGKGEQAHVPLMAGWNHDEGSWQWFFGKDAATKENYIAAVKKRYGAGAEEILKLFPADTEEQMKQSAGRLSTADFIGYGTWRWMEEQKKAAPVYRYEFDQTLPVNPKSPFAAMGTMAPHAGEIEYVFGTLDSKDRAWSKTDRNVSELMQAYWTNFAKTGDPNGPGLPKWPAYGDNFSVMYLSGDSAAKPDEQREQYLGLEKATEVKKTAEARYPDTAEGFLLFMDAMLSEAHKGDITRLGDLVRETGIPHYRDWFSSMYPKDKAESWIEPYGKNLEAREKSLREQLMNIAIADGEIHVRKVNDAPRPGNAMEWGMLHASQMPLDIYYASWSAASLKNMEEPIGYFFFVDGEFRWDSLVEFARVRPVRTEEQVAQDTICPGNGRAVSGTIYEAGGDVTAPKMMKAPAPEYSEEARQAKFSGGVELKLVADVDGCAKNIEVVKPIGYGLDEKAVEALKKWQFEPGKKSGTPVPVALQVSVEFQLY